MTEINREGLEAAIRAAYAGSHPVGGDDGQTYVVPQMSRDRIEAAIRAYLPFHSADAGLVEARTWWMLHILNKMGGTSDASDGGNWFDAFCNDGESDTFNRAIDAGYIRVGHDSRFDTSTAKITDAGREFLRSQAPAGEDGEKPEPEAWQWRLRHRVMKHEANWSFVDYHTGLKIKEHPEKYEVRPLCASPPAPAAVGEGLPLKALSKAYRAWEKEEAEAIDVLEAVGAFLGSRPTSEGEA